MKKITSKKLLFYLLIIACVFMVGSALSLQLNDKLLSAIEKQYGNAAKHRLEDWQNLINSNQSQLETTKLEVVNQFFNQLTYADDDNNWYKKDYWATPIEFLAKGQGDCEDFAIGKYYTLRLLGVPMNRMRITYVTITALNLPHMILAYYQKPESVPLILDNVNKTILPASERTDLSSVYSFNGDSLWLAKQLDSEVYINNSDQISLWQEVKKHMREEKLMVMK